jgi:hypothetical protein
LEVVGELEWEVEWIWPERRVWLGGEGILSTPMPSMPSRGVEATGQLEWDVDWIWPERPVCAWRRVGPCTLRCGASRVEAMGKESKGKATRMRRG